MEVIESRRSWVGREIHDRYGARIGTVIAVVTDPADGQPWAAVNLVRFGERLSFLPAHDVWPEGQLLRCELTREQVRSAPMASHRGRYAHPTYRALLRRHYGAAVAPRPRRAEPDPRWIEQLREMALAADDRAGRFTR